MIMEITDDEDDVRNLYIKELEENVEDLRNKVELYVKIIERQKGHINDLRTTIKVLSEDRNFNNQ